MKLGAKTCIIVVFLVAGVPCMVSLLSRNAVPVEKYNHVAEGMTLQQVRDIMGTPDFIRHDKPETTTFYYGGLQRLKLNNMEVYFSADGHVTGKFDDD
jgi:outer membrane protein assembly factor BamE (lipoprotein component of BamABCDE complex)